MDKINELRKEIDIIDDQIMQLLDKRFTLTKSIGEEKKLISRTVLDPNREKNILNKTSKFSHSPMIKELYEYMMNQSKNQQRK